MPSKGSRPIKDRYRLTHVPDEALHAEVKTLVGRHNITTADLLAHLAEVDARGIYRERACSSLYTYCIYELRLSEDEAQRRTQAARTAREFPVLFTMLAEGAIHLTGLLLLAPYLTRENHVELLARARFRTKREIERLVAEVAPRPDVPARVEPLGPRPVAVANLWQTFTSSLRGPVRDLAPGVARGQALAAGFEQSESGELESPAPAWVDAPDSPATTSLGRSRYKVQFTVSQAYVDLLEEARNLLQHRIPDRDVARVHELAMAVFVAQLKKRRQAAIDPPRRPQASEGAAPVREGVAFEEPAPERVDETSDGLPLQSRTEASDGPAPERMMTQRTRVTRKHHGDSGESDAVTGRHVPAATRRAVWLRDAGCCTFEDSRGRRCDERAGLEIHHEHAFACGGPNTVENLRLMCRAHNALLAERDFGRVHIEHAKRGRKKQNQDRIA